ncbi:Anoctamin-7 [Portunus trituberculatus]|uniref:Anoctamin-7 n=1 Tax=Portunus trituberculatus TaxID=210409 RepID=A0A5B7G0A6_PORTR|nr:Anoctamin-7 [Portunus trituberculatus]
MEHVDQPTLDYIGLGQASVISASMPGGSRCVTQIAHNNPSTNWSEVIIEHLHLPNLMAEDVPNKPLDYFTCAFKRSKIDSRARSAKRVVTYAVCLVRIKVNMNKCKQKRDIYPA